MMKSVLLITIDCLRPDHMSLYGYHRETTPFIDSLVDRGVIFDNAFAVGSSTPFSFTSILTSTYPLDYTIIPSLKDPRRKSIAEILKNHDYRTAGIHSNIYVSDYYDYGRGFDFFLDLRSKKISKISETPSRESRFRKYIKKIPLISRIARVVFKRYREFIDSLKGDLAYARADETTNAAIKWISEQDSKNPIFLWVHYMDPHHPFLSSNFLKNWRKKDISRRESFKLDKLLSSPEKITKGKLNKILDLYDAEIMLTDEHIKKLITKWEEKAHESIIILTADHGEEFLEHGEFSHKAKLYDELIHVPLIFVDDTLTPAKNPDLISLIDIPPTILDLLNLPYEKSFKGKSLFGDDYKPNNFIIAETLMDKNKVSMIGEGKQLIAIRGKKWKYITDLENNNLLFDLENDPQERENIIKSKKDLSVELEKLAVIHAKNQKKTRIKL